MKAGMVLDVAVLQYVMAEVGMAPDISVSNEIWL